MNNVYTPIGGGVLALATPALRLKRSQVRELVGINENTACREA